MKAKDTVAGPWATGWLALFPASSVNPNQLAKARGLVREGAVTISAGTGVATAKVVHGASQFRPRLDVATFTDRQWDTLIAAIAARPALAADVAAAKIPPALADPAHTAELSIIPVPGEVTARCTCPTAAGRHCTHTLALARALAERLVSGPGLLLAIRGLSVSKLAARLRTITPSPDAPEEAAGDQGAGPVRAVQAYRRWANTAPDAAIGVPVHADPLPPAPSLPGDPPPPAPSLDALARLIDDAAVRAGLLLAGAPHDLHDEVTDAVRQLSTPDRLAELDQVADRLAMPAPELRRLLLAHRHGGPAGVHAAHYSADHDLPVLQAAALAIGPLRQMPIGSLNLDGNRITDDGANVEIRRGPDRRWYPFTYAGDDEWRPAAGHSEDPAGAYRSAVAARRARPTRRV